jgi:hypothetical protein
LHALHGCAIDDDIIERSAINGVRTFLLAFGVTESSPEATPHP